MEAVITQRRNVVQAVILLLALGILGAAEALTTDRANEYYRNYDLNRDGKIDKVEWTGRGNFERNCHTCCTGARGGNYGALSRHRRR